MVLAASSRSTPSCDDEAARMTAVASSFEGDPAIVSGMKAGDTS
jgi:hypothetical protein